MAKNKLKGQISLLCDIDKTKKVYHCEMPKLKQKKKPKKLQRDFGAITPMDMHRWDTEMVRIHSEAELPDPFGGVASKAGGNFLVSLPSDAFIDCDTSIKTTKCMIKEK